MGESLPVILVIADQPQMQRFLRGALVSHDCRPVEAASGREGLAQASGGNPDVVLLDLGLSNGDGVDLTRTIRRWSRAPIIVLSARGREQDKIGALDAGADDYLTKPFAVGELMARLRVALRHAAQPESARAAAVFTAHDLRVDLGRRQVWVGDAEVHLTPLQYKLLAALVRHAGQVLTRRRLLKEVWGPNVTEHRHYLRVYMAQLRHKLERDPARPRLFLTESGVGYRLKAE
jgi:two-component system, OmpR family, KDP operon response regulator KdpE